MEHLMVDVEALRLNQPWKAPVMEIGLVRFNERGNISEETTLWVKPGTHPKWAETEQSTLEFWKAQPYWLLLQEAMMLRGGHCKHIIATVHKWASSVDCVWFAGPTYDQVMLEAYFDYYDMERPWKYNNTRDFRTIRKQHPDIYEPLSKDRKGLHNALMDSRFQVGVLREISAARNIEWR